MLDSSDPRSTLASLAATAPRVGAGQAAPADYLAFYDQPPAEDRDGARTWYGRGQNLIVAYSDAEAGATFTRREQPDEWMLLLPDASSRVEITTPDEEVEVAGEAVVVLPPGPSTLRVAVGGRLVRLFTTRADDLVGLCANAASYSQPHPNVALLEPWPDPPGGFKVRRYSLDVPPEPGRFSRIWRCTTLMVAWGEGRAGPRDTARMSPHSHADFEQCSLIIEGEYVHHLRWPWTSRLDEWREDDHVRIGSPSMTIIPPPTIHTSQAIGAGANQLIDIFSPPRLDFSEKPGWVLNAAEYPMP